jgi:hypothetical protein
MNSYLVSLFGPRCRRRLRRCPDPLAGPATYRTGGTVGTVLGEQTSTWRSAILHRPGALRCGGGPASRIRPWK